MLKLLVLHAELLIYLKKALSLLPLLLQIELYLLDLRLEDDLIRLFAFQALLHIQDYRVPLIDLAGLLLHSLLQLGFPFYQLVDLFLQHHVLAVGLEHLVLLLSQLLRRQLLFLADLADELVELGLGHVGKVGIKIVAEEVADCVSLLCNKLVRNTAWWLVKLERIFTDKLSALWERLARGQHCIFKQVLCCR